MKINEKYRHLRKLKLAHSKNVDFNAKLPYKLTFSIGRDLNENGSDGNYENIYDREINEHPSERETNVIKCQEID